MAQTPNSYTELYNAIHCVHSYGIDEFVYIYDIFYPEYSAFLHTTHPLANIKQAIILSHLIESCGLENKPYCGQLQLYWPYHEDWDHVVNPIIIFEPADTNTTNVHGYKYYSGNVHELNIKVSSLDDSTSESYIIIREAEFPYTIYPDFKNGIYTKNGLTWLRPTDIAGQDGQLSYEDQTTIGDTIFEASIYKFQSSGKQYDSWFFGGGSEYAISIARTMPNGIIDTCTLTFELTRKDIKERTEMKIENLLHLHPNWQRSCEYIHYRFFERDGGGTDSQYNVNLTYQGNTLSATFKTKTTDDLIGSGQIYRFQYFNWCQTPNNNKQTLGNNESFWFKIKAYTAL